MADTATSAGRDRGWTPPLVTEPPLFRWPPKPAKALRWIVGVPGYVLPYNGFYLLVAALVWWFATPSAATMRHIRPGWVAFIIVRNALLLVVWFGAWHVRLYRRRAQADRWKFNGRWPGKSGRFTFGTQLRDNVFWTMASGLPIWTAWEVVTLWLFASGHIRWFAWSRHPVWFIVELTLIPMFRDVHFYCIHRLIHWAPLYKKVHSLHHRNTNPSPWSGLSMHPLEHLLYFSSIAIHWIVPAHPIHALYNAVHLAMSPAPGHAGFANVEIGPAELPTGGYAHYLHHKLFEVNYADGAIPLDRWFGSFHDGSKEADERLRRRRKAIPAS